ncbi:MAG: chromosome segregation protein SMC [Deltaproteobacteria bacterium]|nr:chromosome segregation protein SMC [Deltaproteobacteria bacterium]
MRIKRIDLCGFKSFCDRTSIDLSQAITSVVGPNGCGKSNIVDALLWAMGEQRAKHLRGKSMEDVIFNGSDSRGPAGLSEVSITFDNDGRVPLEYLDYAEITVTRRLHRDGTSEYLINKLPVRLMDVTNLFLGTGVGTKAYSIIEQGRVGLIVSAKPEDRRHLIEEAAGITKYRRRKQAAERKMEATRQNLLRVSDVIEEIGKRLSSLRRQAQKAERYKRYKEEMRSIELRFASHRLLGHIAETKVVDAQLLDTKAQQVDAEQDLERQELALEASRVTSMEEERRLAQVQEALYQLDNRVKLAESQAEYQGREATELEERSAQSTSEIEQLTEHLAETEERHGELKTEADSADRHRLELEQELQSHTTIYRSFRDELASLEAAVEAERTDLAQAERKGAAAEANAEALVARRGDVTRRLEVGRAEGEQVLERLAALHENASDLDGELGELRQDLERLQSRREEAVSRLETLREQAKRGEAELEVMRTELHRRRSRLTSLEEIQSRYEGFGEGTRAIMQRHQEAASLPAHTEEPTDAEGTGSDETTPKQGILGVVADVLEAPARYEVALEAALGRGLGTVIVSDDAVGVEAIDYLKQRKEGRSTFISRHGRGSWLDDASVGVVWQEGTPAGPAKSRTLSRHAGVVGPMMSLVRCESNYSRVAQGLLGDVVVVESMEQALTVWEHVDDQTLVTLEGEILGPDGTVSGGSQTGELSGLMRQKREIKELTAIIQDLSQQFDAAMERQVSVKTEIAAVEEIVEETTHHGHRSDKEILTREKDLGRIRHEDESLRRRRERMERELQEMQEQVASMGTRMHDFERQAHEAQEIRHVARDILALLLIEQARLRQWVDEAAAAMTDRKVALAQAAASYRAIAERLAQLAEMARERRTRMERLQRESTKGRERALVLRESVEKLREELTGLVDERATMQESLAEGRKSYEEQLVELGDKERALKVKREEVASLHAEVGTFDVKRREIEMAREHLEEQVWDRYRERLMTVLFDYHLHKPVTDKELERLEQLRQIIHRMGEINLTAIEEFNELNERFEFLSTQKADLEGALGQLQRAIQKINRASRERFKATFDAVNEKFQEVFPRLFRGGRAKLVLTESEDLLQAGVEIIAQPPGKKLASMEIMSGGEKALTATSLIFAMFLVKPTPFCLLDEVDAPLDEANVLRFREMVREMSRDSQFIIITHNRNTMEVSDRLYGVTMDPRPRPPSRLSWEWEPGHRLGSFSRRWRKTSPLVDLLLPIIEGSLCTLHSFCAGCSPLAFSSPPAFSLPPRPRTPPKKSPSWLSSPWRPKASPCRRPCSIASAIIWPVAWWPRATTRWYRATS